MLARRHAERRPLDPRLAAAAQFLVAVYGGYFGAGIGILMLAILGFLGLRDIHAMNGLKAFFGFAINAVAAVVFVVRGAVDWPVVPLMLAGAIAGGYGGARLARWIGARVGSAGSRGDRAPGRGAAFSAGLKLPARLDRTPLVYREEHMSKPNDLVLGTLDLLLLKILALEPLHGWAISLRLRSISGDVLQVSEGSLYPALHKLEQEGWIKAEWKQTENNRRAKFYSLTRLGRKQLESEAANWQRLSTAISHVVQLSRRPDEA